MIQEFLIAVFVVLIVAAITYTYIKNYMSDSSEQGIVSTIQDGKIETTYSTPIPPSKDQPDGIAFTYAGWIKIDDFTYRYGEKKIIFSKGTDDAHQACPALAIDANTNSLLVMVDTYGVLEIVPISNIPAKKWIHFAIGIDQTAVNVYINGTLHTHHTMAQLPKQNSGPVHMSSGGGFSGKLGKLEYYPYLLSPSDVSALSVTPPQQDSGDVGALPPYFGSTWWVKTSRQRSKL
jgi:hypothetical protein